VTHIDFTKVDKWPRLSGQVFSLFIDFSQIVKLSWSAYGYNIRKQPSLIGLHTILEEAQNLLSLLIRNDYNNSSQIIDDLCSIIPRHVKHLKMPVRNLKQIETITKRCENLSTVQFNFTNSKLSDKVMEWFADSTINSTCCTTPDTIYVWIGEKNIQPDQNRFRNKRWKLFCMCSNS
jgi:hypothetical protein